jgi:hypothetical protein
MRRFIARRALSSVSLPQLRATNAKDLSAIAEVRQVRAIVMPSSPSTRDDATAADTPH